MSMTNAIKSLEYTEIAYLAKLLITQLWSIDILKIQATLRAGVWP